MSNVLVVGCGYLGTRVARKWLLQGHSVYVTTRPQSNRTEELARAGYTPVPFDVTSRKMLNLPDLKAVLFAVGFDRKADMPIETVYVQGLANTLEAIPSVEHFVYISSTGVYSQSDDEWVDEDSECIPQRPGGVACLRAEELVRDSEVSHSSTILRLAGIYGPGRVPNQGQIGETISLPTSGFLNLIHVDDAASIVTTATDQKTTGLFCVSDGNPVLRIEYYREVARLSGFNHPTFVAPDPASPRAQRAASSKRIRNDKLRETLFDQFEFCDYRSGLQSIFDRA